MAKELKAKIKLDISKAERELNKLLKHINNIDKASSKVSGNDKLARSIQKAEKESEKLKRALDKAANDSSRLGKNMDRASASTSHLTKKIKQLGAAYLGVMGMRSVIDISDQITGAKNKLNYVNAHTLGEQGFDANGSYSSATLNATNVDLEKIYASSQKVRTGYLDMVGNVSKSMVLANTAFKGNVDNAIRFQEIMAEAYSVGGASAAEQASSMYQMIQALGSGTLQGDELRSVREGAAMAYQAIEKFAQGVYNTDESLKELASQGKITSDIVVAAVLNAGEEMDKAFANTNMTFAQSALMMKNAAIEAFRPVLENLNAILNSDAGQMIFRGIIKGIQIVAGYLNWWFGVLNKFFQFLSKHMNIVRGVLFMIGTLLAVWLIPIVYRLMVAFIAAGAEAIGSAISTFTSWLAALGPLGLVIVIIGAIIALLYALGYSTQEIMGMIAGVVWTGIMFIVNLVRILLNVVATVITAIGVATANLVIAVVNGFKAIWEAGKAIAHNIKVAFVNGFYEAKAAGWDFAANVCNAILKVANLINSVLGIFGLEINTSGLESLMNDARSNAQANRNKKQTYDDVGNALKSGWNSVQFADFGAATTKASTMFGTVDSDWASKAYNQGYNAGTGAYDWISNKISGISGKLSGSNLADITGSSLLKPDAYDVTGAGSAGDLGDIDKNTGKTAKNTKDIKDTLDLTNEDLSYLRKIAEMEWKKEFTTANINIAMTNNNNVNKTTDLDGIATQLAKTLEQELATVAAGSYS